MCLPNVLTEAEIRDQSFQPRVLFFELAESSDFIDAQVRMLLLPGVERRLADAQRPADIANRRPSLGLAQGIGHLFLGELRALHWSHPFPFGDPRRRHRTSVLTCRRFWGRRHV